MNQISYNYYNVPIGGGGYVTGIEFDGSKENILYIRTDIGGLYRFDRSVGKMDKSHGFCYGRRFI